LQYAIADFLKAVPEHNAGLAEFYQRKRDQFLDALGGSGFRWTPSSGTYFQLLDFSAISQQSDMEFVETLLQAGVAAIPLTPFYTDPPRLSVVRFCFAKNESTLQDAAERLRHL
jgi:methionine aminotransferase